MINKKGQENGLFGYSVLLLLGIGLFILVFGLRIVEYNEYAFEREFGTLYQDQKETGFNWIGFGSLQRINNQVRNYEIIVKAVSKDLQDVSIRSEENTSELQSQS